MKLKFVSLVIFLTIFVLAIAIGIVVIKGYISQKQLLPITGKEKPMAIKKESEETLVYLTFVINVHDFVNLTESADVIKKAMEVYKKYNVKGEFYLTSTMWEKYKENYPEIIEVLKDEKHATVSYHIRPPHPVYPGFTSKIEGLNKEELKEILRKYETHSLNLETGNYENKEGGYALMKKDLGYASPSAGIFSDKPEIVETEVEILKEMGLSMIVRHGDGGSLADFGEKKYGLWIRPADFEILEDENGKAWWNTDKKPADLLSEKISYFTEGEHFGVSLIHENNFYMKDTPWALIYYTDIKKTTPKSPPYDLTQKLPPSFQRSENEINDIWLRYEELVKKASEDPNIEIVTSKELIEKLEKK